MACRGRPQRAHGQALGGRRFHKTLYHEFAPRETFLNSCFCHNCEAPPPLVSAPVGSLWECQLIAPFWPSHWTSSIIQGQNGPSGRLSPLLLRPDLDNIQSLEGRRTETVSSASLPLSKTGTLTTKQLLQLALLPSPWQLVLLERLTHWFGTHSQIKISAAQCAPQPSPTPPLGPSQAWAGRLDDCGAARPTAAGFCPRTGGTLVPQMLRQVSPQRCPPGSCDNRIICWTQVSMGKGKQEG